MSDVIFSCLFYGTNGYAGRTGNDEVPLFDFRSDLVQNERDDVGLHGQEENVTLANGLLVAGGEVHAQFLGKSWDITCLLLQCVLQQKHIHETKCQLKSTKTSQPLNVE